MTYEHSLTVHNNSFVSIKWQRTMMLRYFIKTKTHLKHVCFHDWQFLLESCQTLQHGFNGQLLIIHSEMQYLFLIYSWFSVCSHSSLRLVPKWICWDEWQENWWFIFQTNLPWVGFETDLRVCKRSFYQLSQPCLYF